MNLLKPPCPCGHPECRAFGEPLRSTGHSRGCWSGCVQCSRPKRTQARRRIPESVRRQVLVRAEGRCKALPPIDDEIAASCRRLFDLHGGPA